MGRIWVLSVTLTVMLTLWTPSSSTPTPRTPRPSRQNFYNYRPDYDDDQFDGDTNAYSSDFGLRTNNRPTARTAPTTQQTTYADEDPDPSDSWTDDNEQAPLESPPLRSRESSGRSRLHGGWGETPRVTATHHHQATDGSYSFGYDLSDQSRHETSDSFGNVYGWYSYIDDDGILHRVSYSAGPGTGFVVHNGPKSRVRFPIKSPPLIIPESPKYHPHRQPPWDLEEEEQDFRPQRPWNPRRRKPSYVVKIRRPVKKEPAWVYFRPPNPGRFAPGWNPPSQTHKRPIKVNSWEDQSGDDGWSDSSSGYSKDASYSFAYDAGSSKRQEYSDPWGTVRGSYSYIDPTGVRRTVHYTAGAETGFKILSAQPSSVVNTVYREPREPQVVHHQRRPSAFVYHLHPDGGWKPWEGRDDVPKPLGPARRRKRPQNPNNAISHSYHYQSQGPIKPQHQETLLKPTNRQRRPEYPTTKSDPQEVDDQQNPDEEQLILDETRYEALTDPGESKVTDPKIRGYQGGYGDKNPLLVMSSGSQKSAEEQQPETTKKPGLSIAKMMSMRMAQAQRKGKSSSGSSNSKGSRKPEHIPMTMSNSGRLMHYPRSHSDSSNSQQLRMERRIIQAEGN